MSEKNKSHYFDSRIVDRYVAKGVISKKEHEDYIKNLPDDTSRADWVQLDAFDADFAEPILPQENSLS